MTNLTKKLKVCYSFYICIIMFHGNFFEKLKNLELFRIDQVKIIYSLSLVVGLISALAAAFLKNAIHYTNRIVTEGLTQQSTGHLYLLFPVCGMLLTMLFVKYIVRDNIGHGVSRVLYAISKKKSRIKKHNTWTSLVATTLTIGSGGSVGSAAVSYTHLTLPTIYYV